MDIGKITTGNGGPLTPRIIGRGGYGGSETLELLESRRRFEPSQRDPNEASARDDELIGIMGQLLGGGGKLIPDLTPGHGSEKRPI